MNLYTLGTSHGDSTFCRFNSCNVYQTESGALYMVDAGAPAEALLRRRGLRVQNLRAVFITHMHDDHVGGISGVIKHLIKYPGEEPSPVALYLPEEKGIAALQSWMLAMHEPAMDSRFSYRCVEDGVIYEDEELEVTALRTRHLRTLGRTQGDPCSFAYSLYFKKEDRRVLHTGDLSRDFSDFPAVAQTQYFDLCLCEATHYQPEDAMGTLTGARFGRMVLTHIADRWHTRVGIHWEVDDGEGRLLAACKALPYPVQVAHDGDVFRL